MSVFSLISLPLTLGMVAVTLKYFDGPDVPRYVLFTVGYAWFSSLSIAILVPADIWTLFSTLNGLLSAMVRAALLSSGRRRIGVLLC